MIPSSDDLTSVSKLLSPLSVDPAGENEPILEAVDLSCSRSGLRLFTNLSFCLKRGELLTLSGANGSGKTTLLRCLAGMTNDFSGTIRGSRPFVYLGHKSGLAAHLSALENLRWYAGLWGLKMLGPQVLGPQVLGPQVLGPQGIDEKIRAALELFRIPENSQTGSLSAGQRQKLALARLPLLPAALWLLDEPAANLDEGGIHLVRDFCKAHIEAGGAAVISSHHEALLQEPSKRILLGTAA